MIIKDEHYTAITEFEVIAPVCDEESIGDKLTLHEGTYYSKNFRRSCSLLFLIEHPLHYRASKMIMCGKGYDIPSGRELNYAPSIHPETLKYDKRVSKY